VYYPEDRPKPAWDRTEPILPMTDRWADADFSLASNVRKGQDVWDGIEPRLDGGVRLREWCVKLLSRYAYTYGMFLSCLLAVERRLTHGMVGSTISKFLMIHSGRELTTQLKMIDAKEEITLVCFNDDGPDIPPRNGPTIGATLATWMKQR
jgi:3-O-alpha-D-mannopyranosyl-alpha-D-mannopyranose xylosylphosphotransferase